MIEIMIQMRIDDSKIEKAVARIAESEKRSFSSQAQVLILEALAAREVRDRQSQQHTAATSR